MWSGTSVTNRAITGALLTATLLVIGPSSVASAKTGNTHHQPLRDYSVGGDIILNLPTGEDVFSAPVFPRECADGEPAVGQYSRTTQLREGRHIILRVLNGLGDLCVRKYSFVTWAVQVGRPDAADPYADVLFTQTHFGALTQGDFEVQCPTDPKKIKGLTCTALNERTVELTKNFPTTLSCKPNVDLHQDGPVDDLPICDVTGWPAPSLKVVASWEGTIMTVRRSPANATKERGTVVLTAPSHRHAGVSRITITAEEPPYPTQNVMVNVAPNSTRANH